MGTWDTEEREGSKGPAGWTVASQTDRWAWLVLPSRVAPPAAHCTHIQEGLAPWLSQGSWGASLGLQGPGDICCTSDNSTLGQWNCSLSPLGGCNLLFPPTVSALLLGSQWGLESPVTVEVPSQSPVTQQGTGWETAAQSWSSLQLPGSCWG